MYKKFYVAKTFINILLMGILCFYIFFDEINYVIGFLVLTIALQIVFIVVSKTKFAKEEVTVKNNMALNILLILTYWASMYFNRFLLVVTWLTYVFIELKNYNDAKEYFN